VGSGDKGFVRYREVLVGAFSTTLNPELLS
jgi:hypothetical protein